MTDLNDTAEAVLVSHFHQMCRSPLHFTVQHFTLPSTPVPLSVTNLLQTTIAKFYAKDDTYLLF